MIASSLVAAGGLAMGTAFYFSKKDPMKSMAQSVRMARKDFDALVHGGEPLKGSRLAAIFKESGWSNYVDTDNGVPKDWCGMAVAAWAHRAGMHPEHRKSFWATEGVRSFFSYLKVGSNRRTVATVAGVPIAQAHKAAGSMRTWLETKQLRATPLNRWPLVAGGVVLIAHKGQMTGANHIALVEAWDGRTLTTLEGNASGFLADGSKTRSGVVRKTRDLTDTKVRHTIFGVGVFSKVDFR